MKFVRKIPDNDISNHSLTTHEEINISGMTYDLMGMVNLECGIVI